MRFVCLALAVLGCASLADAQAPSDSSARFEDPWRWLGASPTPDVELQLVAVGRDTVGSHARVRLKALALGFAPGEHLAAWDFHAGERRGACLESGFVVDSTGRVVCDPRTRAATDTCAACMVPLDQVILTATGYAPGEPYRIGVVSSDGRRRAYAETIPNPVESVVDSMRIHLEMMDPFGLDYVVVGEGFRPGSKIGVSTRSGDQSGTQKMIVPASGTFRLEVLPQIAGAPTGFTSVTITAGHRHLTLDWEWGRGAFKH
jgi:hypothetical protein